MWDRETVSTASPASQGDASGRNEASRVVCMPGLANSGWGNTFFQYAFLRAFAKEHGYGTETPRWIGQTLCGFHDPPIRHLHTNVLFDRTSLLFQWKSMFWSATDKGLERAATVVRDSGRTPFQVVPDEDPDSESGPLPAGGVDLEGGYFLHTAYFAPYRDFIRSLFRPVAPIRECLEPAVDRLRSRGKTVVGIHVRLGDYAERLGMQAFEYIAPMSAYRAWLERVWPELKDPVLFVASDAPAGIVHALSDYDPVTSRDIGAAMPDGLANPDAPDWQWSKSVGFFPDWYLLTQCDRLAISNSTFSFSASMLNDRAVEFVRPTLDRPSLQPFDPWDAEPLLLYPASRWVPVEMARRLRAFTRACGIRQLPRLFLRSLRWYRRILHHRAQVCRFYRGRSGMVRAMTTPAFYLRSRHRYDTDLD